MASASAILGGPALYLAGNALFKRLSAPNMPLSHLVGLGLLASVHAVAPVASPLVLSAATHRSADRGRGLGMAVVSRPHGMSAHIDLPLPVRVRGVAAS